MSLNPQRKLQTQLLQILSLLIGAVIVTVIFTRWHLIAEGREIDYFDLAGGIILTLLFTLSVYNWLVAELRKKELYKESENLKVLEEKFTDLSSFPAENPNPVLRVARDGSILGSNDSCLLIFENIGVKPGSPLPGVFEKAVFEALTAGTRSKIEIHAEERWFLFDVIPVPAKGYVNLYGIDITERMQAENELVEYRNHLEEKVSKRTAELQKEIAERKVIEEQLRTNNEVLEKIFATTHFAIVYLDRDFNFIRVNRSYADSCGHPPEFFPGKNHFELYHHAENEAIFRNVVETGKPFTIYAKPFEFPDHPEWGITYWDWSLYPVLSANGAVDGLVFALLDVTKRKIAEEELTRHRDRLEELVKDRTSKLEKEILERSRLEDELKKGEALYRTLIEQLPPSTWVYIARPDETVSTVYVGPQVESLGFSRGEWINNRDYWSRQLHPDDRGRVLAEFRQRRNSDQPFSCEYRLLTRDGAIRWYVDQTVLVKDDAGNPLFFQGLMTDITDVKKSEEERLRLEQQLLQAQKMEAVGQLAAGIAHDFNNILTTVTGYAQFLMMKFKDDDPLRTFVEEIERAGEKGAELVKNILTFSRTEEFGPVVLDLNEVVRGTAGMLSTLIGEDIQLVEDLDDRKLMVLADKVQIEQVLVNLATNARDAMPDVGKLTITTKLTSSVPQLPVGVDSGYDLCALLTVSDTGSGMDEETSKRIFEPFFTTKEVGKGTGLGLSMVYGTIIRHNGCIDVVSEPGKGTTFNIYLPIVDENSHLVESLQGDSASRLPIYCSISRDKILIAEDEAFLRSFTVSLLTEYGYRCIEAVDGEDAVVKFMDNKETVKLLIADVVMPKKNGRDVYEEIRKIEPDMKVIYISGHPKGLLSSKGVEDSDGVVVLKKPFTPDMLLSRIREMIG